ncbi:major facilitator superfamily domain-containing protein [Ephemerocybe angulata]|uniref:Major facilitator superfamily domain-containing protein n=1 Tax=Ephemerocybe angulata TaxID=980116 RepID=A0A8H6HLC9_9AGAR|nr:major facilitator superfamily domain-containing protein [Tulosesus angulatus]
MSAQEHVDDATREEGQPKPLPSAVIVEERRRKVERTPLPKLQLAVVFLVQFAEPVTAMVIYPFVNQLVRETGITGGNEAKTGYYAGIIESTFFLSETLTVLAWGWLSDQVGRKPVLILGPLGLSFAMLGFGLSKTFWPLVLFRTLQGFFNGNIGVSKSVIAEITDSTNIGDAYALTPLMWSCGTTLGPMLGGLLSNPAAQWPDTLGKIAFLRQYPYFLPCAAASFVAFVSFAVSFIAMKETLPPSRKTNNLKASWARLINKFSPTDGTDESRAALLSDPEPAPAYGTTTPPLHSSSSTSLQGPNANVETKVPPITDLLVPDYIATVLNYGFFSFLDMSVSALIPLIYSTPIKYGGLGMDPFTIGVIMGTYGISKGVLLALFLGKTVRRYGPTKLIQTSIFAQFVSMSAFPVANLLARRAGGADGRVACVIILQYLAQTMVAPCYSSMTILVVRSCPNKLLLGSANGAAQTLTSASRAFAPAIASSLFSLSVQRKWAGGYAVYYIFLVLVLLMVRMTRYLPAVTLD